MESRRLQEITASLLNRMAARKASPKKSEKRQSGTNLWKYTCPETEKDFYLPVKQVTVKSPFTGKSFSAKPEKDSLSEVGKNLKEEAKTKKANFLNDDVDGINPHLSERLKDEMEKVVRGAGKVLEAVAYAPAKGGGMTVLFDTEYAALKAYYFFRSNNNVRLTKLPRGWAVSFS